MSEPTRQTDSQLTLQSSTTSPHPHIRPTPNRTSLPPTPNPNTPPTTNHPPTLSLTPNQPRHLPPHLRPQPLHLPLPNPATPLHDPNQPLAMPPPHLPPPLPPQLLPPRPLRPPLDLLHLPLDLQTRLPQRLGHKRQEGLRISRGPCLSRSRVDCL